MKNEEDYENEFINNKEECQNNLNKENNKKKNESIIEYKAKDSIILNNNN